MAFRGRGRGRGRGGSFMSHAKQEPFNLFPDIELPKLPSIGEVTKEEMNLIVRNASLQSYWKSSPYYLEESSSKKSQDTEIERYSDRKKTKAGRHPLSYHLKLTSTNFPLELIQGSRRIQHDQRKVIWNPKSDLTKLDELVNLETKIKNQNKEDDDEEHEEEEIDEEEGEYSDDGDYNQNRDFDDDDDDYNLDNDDADEPIY